MKPLLYYIRNFSRPVLILGSIMVFGSVGYHLVEGWNFLDSIFMTLITLTTVGYGEVHPLTRNGKIFTLFLISTGIFFYAVTINSILQVFLEQKFSDFMFQMRMKKTISELKNHIIIAGGGRMAVAIGEEFEKAKKQFVFIEKSTDAIVMEYKNRWPIILKDALVEDSLIEAGILNAHGLASVLTNDADNLFTILSARKLNPKLVIQTRVDAESTLSIMQQAGADAIVSPKRIGGLQIARSFINPEVHSFLSVVLDSASHYEFEMKVHQVKPDDNYMGKTIREASFREEGYIVIAIRHSNGKMHFAPSASNILKEGQELFLIGASKDEI